MASGFAARALRCRLRYGKHGYTQPGCQRLLALHNTFTLRGTAPHTKRHYNTITALRCCAGYPLMTMRSGINIMGHGAPSAASGSIISVAASCGRKWVHHRVAATWDTRARGRQASDVGDQQRTVWLSSSHAARRFAVGRMLVRLFSSPSSSSSLSVLFYATLPFSRMQRRNINSGARLRLRKLHRSHGVTVRCRAQARPLAGRAAA